MNVDRQIIMKKSRGRFKLINDSTNYNVEKFLKQLSDNKTEFKKEDNNKENNIITKENNVHQPLKEIFNIRKVSEIEKKKIY